MTTSFRAPVEALAKLERSHEREHMCENRPQAGNARLFYGAWALCTSLIEFSLGIDLVDAFGGDF